MNASVKHVAAAKGEASPKREQILAAAEACFVRNGFHRTTMQDIAREAAMSPANIYRYFESKDDVVVSLAARESERGILLLASLQASGDKRTELTGIIDAYFVAAPRETAVLRLEIWTEVTRNPRFSALAEKQEQQFRAWFSETMSHLATSPDCDLDSLYEIARVVLNGMVVNRALLTDYDPAPAASQLYALLDAGLVGRLPTSSASVGH